MFDFLNSLENLFTSTGDSDNLEGTKDAGTDLPAGAERLGNQSFIDATGLYHNDELEDICVDYSGESDCSFEQTYGTNAWRDSEGVIHNSEAGQGNPSSWLDGAGLYQNPSLDQQYADFMAKLDYLEQDIKAQNPTGEYRSMYANPALDMGYAQVMKDSQALVEQLEEQNRYNWEHGIFPPLRISAYTPSLSLDGMYAMLEPASGANFGGISESAESLADRVRVDKDLADGYAAMGLDRASERHSQRVADGADKLSDLLK